MKLKQLLLTYLLAVLGAMTANAAFDIVEVDGIRYMIYAKNAAVYQNNYSGDVVIPESFEYDGITYRVITIGGLAFSECSDLTSVTIPSSVTSIGAGAFSGCSGLTSISIPNSVTTIDNNAFTACSGLTSVNIPNSVTSIGRQAFWGCSSLTSVTIPSSVTYIDYMLFEECSGLTSVTIESGVTTIGDHAFYGCISLTSLTIPNSVTSIGDWAFCGCSGLTSLTIPGSVTSIYDSAFSDCSSLTSINVETGNTKYDSRNNCNAIIETTNNTLVVGCQNTIIPGNVTSIGNYAFRGRSGLTSITIPNSVTSISVGAFQDCSGLTSVTIPNSVTTIGNNAFKGCIGLTSVSIPNSVTTIGHGAFSGCGLTSIIIPRSVTSIGFSTFAGCESLTSVTIPNSVTSIGDRAFYGCLSLTSITIPSSVTYIGFYAFAYCSSLTDFYIYAENVPETDSEFFEQFLSTPIASATLHVPAGSLEAYCTSPPWSSFGNIVAIEETSSHGFSNNKLYTLTCKRGGLVLSADATGLAAGQIRADAPEADKRFAIITYEGAQYLYSPVNKQYLLYGGHFVSCLGSPITFDDTHADDNYKFMLSTQNENGETIYFNNYTESGIIVDDYDTPDDGNRWLIEPVADFDPTEALALAVPQTFTVTYNVMFDGNVVATATKEVAPGSALPPAPASLSNDFITLTEAGTNPTTITEDVTATYTAEWKGPFEFTKTEDGAKWYNMHIRSGYYVGKQETEPYYPAQVNGATLETPAYQWAFGGDPYHVKVYNRTTGLSETLTKDGDNAVMRSGDYTWDLLPNSDGFVLRVTGTENSCINQLGGDTGSLQIWTNSGSPTDNGSTFRVCEVIEEVVSDSFSNNKLYTLTCKRGGLVLNADATGLAAGQIRTDAPEVDKRFAIITYEGAQYLYSPVNKQYLLYDGSFVNCLGSPITFDGTHPDGNYKFMLSTQNENGEILYFNNNGSHSATGIEICGWDILDDGNRWLIEPVADFDPTEALALAASLTFTVTYNVMFDGNVVATATEEVTYGSALPPAPASLSNDFITLTEAGINPATVIEDVTVTYTAEWKGPFEFTKTEDSAKWYNMRIRDEWDVSKQETEPYYPEWNVDEATRAIPAYQWAFGGDPYHVKVYNRTTGLSETLTKDGDNAVMRSGDYTWDLLPNNGGFVLRVMGTEYSCINHYGGANGPLKFWTNSQSLTDGGSTFRVEEAIMVSFAQTLSLTELPAMTYGDEAYTLPATTDQGQTFTWTSSNTDVATINGNVLTIKGAGTAIITASQAGNSQYQPFSKEFTLNIAKAPLIVSIGNYTRKQGEANPDFVISYDSFKNNETEDVLKTKPTATTSATVSSEPGEYEIVVSGGEAQNYELSYKNGKLTIIDADPVTVTANSYTIAYGDAIPEFGYTSSGAILDGTPTISCEATSASPVGTYPIVISKGSVANYNDSYVNGTLTITKALLTVSVGNYTKKQGEANPEFVLSYDGFKNNETEDVLTTKPTATTSATVSSEPGEYEIVVSGGEAQNYELSYMNGKLTITDADPIKLTAKSYTRKYGEANPVFEFTVEGAALDGEPEIICEATATSPVGEYPIIIRKGSVKNYNDSYVNGVLTVTKAPLTIAAGTYTKKQGEENPEFVLSYEGFKNNETKDVLTKQAKVVCEAIVSSAPSEYPVTVSGAEAQNYEISYVNGKLIVTDADPIKLTAKSYTRKYGEANPVFEFTVEGAALDGEPEIICEATATSPVGEYPIIIKKGSVKNYNDSYVNGVLTITKAPLTVSIGNYTKKQYDPMPEFSVIYDGFKNNETKDVLTKQPEVNCEANEDSAPGEYPIAVSGAEAVNYQIQYIAGKLTVTEPDSYTLTYIVDGEVYQSFIIKYRDRIAPLEAPTKEGYTFSGWSEIPETMPAHDVIVTGNFIINQYTLAYIIDGKEYKSYKIDYNAVIVPISAPVKKGMTFSGWSEIPERMPAHDVTVTGTYSWLEETIDYVIYQVTDTLNNHASVIGNEYIAGKVEILPTVEIGGDIYTVNCIGRDAFAGCSGMTSIIIPESVVSIGCTAFEGCTNLQEIYCNAGQTPEVESDAFDNVDVNFVMLVVPDNSAEEYKAHPVWGLFWIETPTSIKEIEIFTPALSKGEGDWYDLSGRKIDEPRKGINIIRYFDGTSRKVLMK